MLVRDPGPNYGLLYGQLLQSIDATPYRGQRVRLRAWMRAAPGAAGGRGHLRLGVVRAALQLSYEPKTAESYRNPVTSEQWQERTLEADVPSDALRVDFGAVLVGDGRLWIDDVGIDALGPILEAQTPAAAAH
jgi:erythromycin esterase